jgi:hypothetical protein
VDAAVVPAVRQIEGAERNDACGGAARAAAAGGLKHGAVAQGVRRFAREQHGPDPIALARLFHRSVHVIRAVTCRPAESGFAFSLRAR